MTHYILVGGGDMEAGDQYGQEIAYKVSQLVGKKNLTILSCLFASKDEEWTEDYEVLEPWFKKYFTGCTVIRASYDKFTDQLKDADVVYFHGGLTSRLVENMERFANVEEYLRDKVVIGSSAGAGFLATAYWSYNARNVGSGSGIIERAVIAHYGASKESAEYTDKDWIEAEYRLAEYIDHKMPIEKIPEGKFVVFEKTR